MILMNVEIQHGETAVKIGEIHIDDKLAFDLFMRADIPIEPFEKSLGELYRDQVIGDYLAEPPPPPSPNLAH